MNGIGDNLHYLRFIFFGIAGSLVTPNLSFLPHDVVFFLAISKPRKLEHSEYENAYALILPQNYDQVFSVAHL